MINSLKRIQNDANIMETVCVLLNSIQSNPIHANIFLVQLFTKQIFEANTSDENIHVLIVYVSCVDAKTSIQHKSVRM